MMSWSDFSVSGTHQNQRISDNKVFNILYLIFFLSNDDIIV